MMLEGSNILLVDDNPETIGLLSDCLALNDCNVLKAESAKQALDAVGSNKVDIAVLDINLPDMNGIALLDALKVHDPTLAVVMITGYPEPNFVVEAMKKGASDFLVKPFELDKLMMVMMRVLRERELLVEKRDILSRLEDKKKIEVLNRELQKKIEELTIMFHISNKLNALSLVDDVYEKTVQIVREVLDVESCAYYLADKENQELILLTEKADNGGIYNPRRIGLSDDFVSKSVGSRRHVYKNSKLFLPLVIKDELIGFVNVNKRKGSGRFSDEEIFLLKLIAEKASAKIENRMLYESLYNSILHMLSSLIVAINRRDSYTEGHCGRVTEMCLRLGDKMAVTEYEKNVARIVGPVHDLGKVGIPDDILLKTGKLTDEEYRVMKGHSIYGEEIMRRFEILAEEATIIRHHHEGFNGQGYPDGLSGEQIPLCCRLMAVCDAYDAMTTNRPYRKALKKSDALAEIKRCSGIQFDPDVASAFLSIHGG